MHWKQQFPNNALKSDKSVMNRFLLTTTATLFIFGCSKQPPPRISNAHMAEGVYSTPSEISGFSGTILELKAGKFRYWFYSDVRLGDEPEYPLTGQYDFQNGKVILNNPDVNQRKWNVDVLNGTPVLWRDDALKIWKQEQKIYDYGVLIWTENKIQEDNLSEFERTSVSELYSKEKKKQIKEWKDPFVHGPQ